MKTILALLTLSLAGCAGTAFSPTPQYDLAASRARAAKPDDVRFCEYEAAKFGQVSQDPNIIMQAVETQERRMQVFNACLTYKGYN